MDFNEDNKVIIETMNKEEARAFKKFLKSEIIRHHLVIKQALNLMGKVREMFGWVEK